MSILYDRIILLCESRSISGYKLCKDIGISPNTLTELKAGRRDGVSARTANKIATYFNVSVSFLLGEENEKSPTPEGVEPLSEARIKLLEATANMSEEEVLAMIELAEAAKRMRGDRR